ncbi:MAG: hypothetical protein MJZ20_11315 [Bacteroidaceae bacterium]|nr:hypothetical protein [Bacteroidaceae bacterium]
MTIEEQDDEIIRRWNSVVADDDDVWILGDISWYSPEKTIQIFSRLKGNKHLCVGNHDQKLLKNNGVRDMFVEIVDYKELYLDKKHSIILCHYPIPCYKNHYYGWYHLYGHVHTSFEWNMMQKLQQEMRELYDMPSRMYNVGCMIDYMNYTPRTLDEILDSVEKKKGGVNE